MYLSTWSYVCLSISLHVTNFSHKWLILVFLIFCIQLWGCNGWYMIGPYCSRKLLSPQFLGKRDWIFPISFSMLFQKLSTFFLFLGINRSESSYDVIISCVKPISRFLVLKYRPKHLKPIKLYDFLTSGNSVTN